jgi:hypothetical protein
VLVEDGFRAAAQTTRPPHDVADVPKAALANRTPAARPADDGIALARVVYAAIERDSTSADDPVRFEGSGLFYFDRSGRPVVVTARSLVDGNYTVTDTFGGDPEIADEQIKVRLVDGSVLRAGRVWVDPAGADIAVLVLEDVPRTIAGTPAARLHLAGKLGGETPGDIRLRRMVPDGATSIVETSGESAFAIYGRAAKRTDTPAVVSLELLPADLRPQ